MIVYLLAFLLLTAGCEGSISESSPTEEEKSGQLLGNIAPISEIVGTPSPEIPPLPTFTKDEIVLGNKVYIENCAECHGDNLEGEVNWKMQNEDGSFRSPPHDETGHTWHHGDNVLLGSIELGGARLPENIGGISNMPAFAEILSDEEIAAVLVYIKSKWPDDIRSIQWEQTVFEQNQ